MRPLFAEWCDRKPFEKTVFIGILHFTGGSSMKSVRRFFFVFIATVLTGGALLIGCGGGGSTSGSGHVDACGRCSNTSDCETGYTCLNYGGTYRCGRLGLSC
jgi:hypothetical protein